MTSLVRPDLTRPGLSGQLASTTSVYNGTADEKEEEAVTWEAEDKEMSEKSPKSQPLVMNSLT